MTWLSSKNGLLLTQMDTCYAQLFARCEQLLWRSTVVLLTLQDMYQ